MLRGGIAKQEARSVLGLPGRERMFEYGIDKERNGRARRLRKGEKNELGAE